MKHKSRLYNVIFPVWMLIWFPSALWVLIIPANLLIDYLVCAYGLKKSGIAEYKNVTKKVIWKICPAGFLADLIGALILFLITITTSESSQEFFMNLSNAIAINPFSNILAFLITLAAVVVSALCIYFFDRFLLKKSGIDESAAQTTAKYLAVLTSPYLFLLPIVWFL